MDFMNDHTSSFYSPQHQQSDAPQFSNQTFNQGYHDPPSFHNPSYHDQQPGQQQQQPPPQQGDAQFSSSAFPNVTPNQEGAHSPESTHTTGDRPQFDIFEWYPRYQSCQRYFLERAQHSGPVQAVAAFINIRLPFTCGVHSTVPPGNQPGHRGPSASAANNPDTQNNSAFSFSLPDNAPQLPQSDASPTQTVSLIPYLRRLVVTGLDFPGVLHGFFGDDWAAGIGPLHEQERRNYMFAAKSGGWASVKRDYDVGIGGGGGGGGGGGSSTGGGRSQGNTPAAAGMSGIGAGGMMINDETVPFMRQLQNPKEAELRAAEKAWSEWLLMEDWLIGPRAPAGMRGEGEERGRTDDGPDGQRPSLPGQGGQQGQEQGQRQRQGQGQVGVGEMR